MAVYVVDRLEAVEVEHQHGGAVPVVRDVRQGLVELLVEVAPVRQAGQRIVARHFARDIFGRAARLISPASSRTRRQAKIIKAMLSMKITATRSSTS